MKRLSLLLLVLCLLLPALALAENPYPTIKFYSNNYVAAVGDQAYVKVTVSKAGSQAGTLELRNHRGEVLATRNYKAGTKEYNFSFTPWTARRAAMSCPYGSGTFRSIPTKAI